MRSLGTTMKSSPCRPQLEKAMHSNEDLTQPKIRINKWINLYKRETKRTLKRKQRKRNQKRKQKIVELEEKKKMYDFERIACWETGQRFYYMPHTENTKCWWGTTGVITHYWYKCKWYMHHLAISKLSICVLPAPAILLPSLCPKERRMHMCAP